jgi:hypothetical protein
MAAATSALHQLRFAHRLYVPLARMRYIIVRAADARAAAGRRAPRSRLRREVDNSCHTGNSIATLFGAQRID